MAFDSFQTLTKGSSDEIQNDGSTGDSGIWLPHWRTSAGFPRCQECADTADAGLH